MPVIRVSQQIYELLLKIKEEKKLRSMDAVLQHLLSSSKCYFCGVALGKNTHRLSDEIHLCETCYKKLQQVIRLLDVTGLQKVTLSGPKEQVGAQKEGIGPKEEPVAQFSLYDYCVLDQNLKPKLEQVAREAQEYNYDYEILKLQDDIYVLILKPEMRATFRIENKEFRLRALMKRTLWLRKSDLLVLAFRAPRTIHIDVFQFGKKIATLRAPF